MTAGLARHPEHVSTAKRSSAPHPLHHHTHRGTHLRDALEHVGLERHVLLQRVDAAPRLRQLLLPLRHQLLLGLQGGVKGVV